MEGHPSRWSRLALVLACTAMACLAGTATASAVQTSQYDAFQHTASCPTKSPFLNNPAFPEAICVSSKTGKTLLTLGKFKTEVTSPTQVGFALAPGAVEPEECPYPCFRSVPGSTVIDQEPIRVNFPKFGHGRASFPGWDQRGWPGSAFSIKATMEPAGDVHAFTIFSSPTTPVFKMPVRLHLEGPLLGRDCYIGSSQSPVELAPVPISAPVFEELPDPNGFPLSTLVLHGFNLADNAFSTPAAQGCGPAIGFGKYRFHLFDAPINAILGLPSPAGKNLLVLNESDTTLVGSQSGGAVMTEAFKAARRP